MIVSDRKIPLLDLQAQHKQIREEVLAAIVRVVDSQKFILGELAAESLALPIQSELTSDDIAHVCRTIQRFYQ